MTPETLFAQAGMLAMLGWAVLIAGPRRVPWINALPGLALPALLSGLYAALALMFFAGAEGRFGSLAEVRTLFADDWVLLAAWVHYLAFDLVVGSLVAARMDLAGVSRIIQAPILPLVFLFGPLGALLALLMQGSLRLGRAAPKLPASATRRSREETPILPSPFLLPRLRRLHG